MYGDEEALIPPLQVLYESILSYMFLFDALCLFSCWKDIVCWMCRRLGSAVNAPAMKDEARPTAGEKDEPMTKNIHKHVKRRTLKNFTLEMML